MNIRGQDMISVMPSYNHSNSPEDYSYPLVLHEKMTLFSLSFHIIGLSI